MPKKDYSKKGPKTLAGKINRIVNKNIETKNVASAINYAAGSAFTSYSPTAQLVVQLAQGGNINERNANVVNVKRIQIRVAYTMTLATVQTMVRTLVVRIKQQINTTVPVITNILASTGSDLATISPYASGPESNDYFDVLYDKSFIMCSNNQTSHHEVINLYPKQLIHFNGAGATDCGKGALWLFTMSNQQTAGGACPYTNIGFDVWYKDG